MSSPKCSQSSPRSERAAVDTWEAFSTRPNLQPGDGWHRNKIPEELQRIEDDSNLPEKLQQILAWSLILDAGPSTARHLPPRGRETGDSQVVGSSQDSGSAIPQNPADAIPQILTPPEIGDENDLESRSIQSERPSERRRLKAARFMGSAVVGSTLDIIATLKGKTEKNVSAGPATNNTTPTKTVVLVECTSCFDELSVKETTKLPCSHSYCKPCLTTLITTAMQNESSFPPKCCLTELPLQTVLLPLDAKQREAYKEKAAEYAIPAQERWYCPNTTCLKWISPSRLQRMRVVNHKCHHCGTKIFSVCRGLAHQNSAECPQDYGLQATIDLAELEGWRRCYKCRTMVERTQGCRHMTCKCGAQFCYSCGVKWRTCSCTEADEFTRQVDLRRRRDLRAMAIDAEAAEIARIIAEVQALERLEAEERQREDEQREMERFREEAELARLEEQRLREEESRRLEEERTAQELRQILRLSVEESCNTLQMAWSEFREVQRQTLDNKHVNTEKSHARELEDALTRQQQENDESLARMESNIDTRAASIRARHDSEVADFNAAQQDLEDDMFLEIQKHLRGKTDKEARERRLQQRFQKEREEQLLDLTTRHQSEAESLKANAIMELQGLRLSNDGRLARLEHRYRVDFETMALVTASDRAWFQFLCERRQNMVAANGRLMLEALDRGEDPVGLTQEDAMTIGPFVADLEAPMTNGEDGVLTLPLARPAAVETTREVRTENLAPSPVSSSTSPARSLIELAATSEQLLSSLGPPEQPPPLNSAFAWMTGSADEGGAPVSGITRHRNNQARRSPPLQARELHPRRAIRPEGVGSTAHGATSRASPPIRSPPPPPTPAADGVHKVLPLSPPPPPPVPKVPEIFLAPSHTGGAPTVAAAAAIAEQDEPVLPRQPRGLGGLVPVLTVPEEKRRRVPWASHSHTRQSSSDSSGSMLPSSSNSSSSSPAPSNRSSSSDAASSATSVSSVDSLPKKELLHRWMSGSTGAKEPLLMRFSAPPLSSPSHQAPPASKYQLRASRAAWIGLS